MSPEGDRRLRLAGALVALVLAMGRPAAAEPGAPAADPRTEQAAAARVPERRILPEDVSDRAELLLRLVESRRRGADLGSHLEEMAAALAEADGDLHEADVGMADGASSWLTLWIAHRQLQDSIARLEGWKDELAGEARRLAAMLEEFGRAAEQWERTRTHPDTIAAGDEVVRRVERSLATLENGRTEVEGVRRRVLALGDRVLDRTTWALETRDKLEAAGDQLRARMVSPERPPIWDRALLATAVKEWPDAPGLLHRFRASTVEYLARDPRPFLLQFLVGLLAVLLLRRLHADAGNRLPSGHGGLLARPYAVAALLALSLSSILHPSAPQRVMQLLALAAALPAVRVLALAGQPVGGFVAAGLLGVIAADRMVTALVSLPAISSLLFLGQAVVALACVEAMRRAASATGQVAASVILAATRFALVVVILAAIGGWSNLAVALGHAVIVSGVGWMYALAVVDSIRAVAGTAIASALLRRSRFLDQNQQLLRRWMDVLAALCGGMFWLSMVTTALGVRRDVGEAVASVLQWRVSLGEASLSAGGVFGMAAVVLATAATSRLVQELLEDEVFPRMRLPRGMPHVLLALGRYAIWSLGLLLALSAAGVPLGQLAILLGGLGVGVGLGLQDVVKNFAAGLSLLLERRIHIGDSVEISGGEVSGRVVSIGTRASVVRSANGAEVVLPNETLFSASVTNWTLSDRLRRVDLAVSVDASEDPVAVMDVLVTVARADGGVRRDPPPTALFKGFGAGTLDFELRAWIDQENDGRVEAASRLGVAACRALDEAGIARPSSRQDVSLVAVDQAAADALRAGVEGPAPTTR